MGGKGERERKREKVYLQIIIIKKAKRIRKWDG